jgi:hypothetical protein
MRELDYIDGQWRALRAIIALISTDSAYQTAVQSARSSRLVSRSGDRQVDQLRK